MSLSADRTIERVPDLPAEELRGRILEALEKRGPDRPLGLEALAAEVEIPVDALRTVCEPPLLRLRLIRRTRFGRAIARTTALDRHETDARLSCLR